MKEFLCADFCFLAIFSLWIPAVFIFAISVMNESSESGGKKLLVFYAVMLASALSNIFGEMLIGGTGSVTGLAIGMLAGTTAGSYACSGPTDKLPCIEEKSSFLNEMRPSLCGGFAGGMIGLFTSRVAEKDFLLLYFLFLFAVLLGSFCIVKIYRPVKDWLTMKILGGPATF